MPDFLRRALRTFVQAFLGVLVSSGVLSATNTSGVVDWSAVHKVAVSAAAAGIVAVVSLLQNFLEDSPTVKFPAYLKAEASSGQHPVTVDPAGSGSNVTTDPAVWVVPDAAHQHAATLAATPAKKAAPRTRAKTPARRS